MESTGFHPPRLFQDEAAPGGSGQGGPQRQRGAAFPPAQGGKGGAPARQAEGAGQEAEGRAGGDATPGRPPEGAPRKTDTEPPQERPRPPEKWSAGLIGPRNPAEGGMPGEGGPGGGARRGGGGARRRGAGEQKGRESRSQQARQEKERKRERTERKRKVGENLTSSHKKTIDSYGGKREN